MNRTTVQAARFRKAGSPAGSVTALQAGTSKGQIAYMNPRRLGLGQFSDQDTGVFFRDIFQEYNIHFEEAFDQLRSALSTSDDLQAIPSEAPIISC